MNRLRMKLKEYGNYIKTVRGYGYKFEVMISIKKKLFLQIGSLIVFLVILLILANTLLLESYYTYTQKNYYTTINSISSSNYDDNLKQFLSIINFFGFCYFYCGGRGKNFMV
ncbi:helix-turn-helix domain-containing protein [Clostridium sp.]|uniref:helix-turn-helix domain-containing protein n=1 Tax=Clostridium sp. TaxID=1506 RepID=UPI00345B534D